MQTDLKVLCSSVFRKEKEYILGVLLGDMLGVSYSIDWNERTLGSYILQTSNGGSVTIRDDFFCRYGEPHGYLVRNAIPSLAPSCPTPFAPHGEGLPVLYGKPLVVTELSHVQCEIDIFAGAFFFLTRWEEYVVRTRDRFGRFPASESLSARSGLLIRPVVNEYVEALWTMLRHVGHVRERKKHCYELVLTHDVDKVHCFNTRGLLGDLFIRRSLRSFLGRMDVGIHGHNPYDTFGWIMDMSEARGLVSRFYILVGQHTAHDGAESLDDPLMIGSCRSIVKRGHILGFHPSFSSHTNDALWLAEKELLQAASGVMVQEGRQHFLRFSVPTTWRIWELGRMSCDSTLGFPEEEGFRCGTGMEFPVFDVLAKRQLSIRERPLIVMDGTLRHRKQYTITRARCRLLELADICRRYRMPYTVLFHNSSFDDFEWRGYRQLYSDFLTEAT